MSITILLADEHTVMRKGLRALLEKDPEVTIVAESRDSRTTVRLAQDLSPDLVVLDVTTGELSGIDTTKEIIAKSAGVKVIALSVHSDRRLALNLLKAGASAYLLKDRVFEELVPAIRQVLAHKIFLSPGISDLVLKDYVEALRDSEARFRTVFECAPFGIALTDLDGRLLEISPALDRMLGYSRDEFHNMTLAKFSHPDDAESCRNLFRELAQGRRRSFEKENRYLRKDGRLVWGRLTVSVVRSLLEQSQFAVAIVEDINERKKSEEEIRAYQAQLRALASEISLVEERERRRLATDLHDHIGQNLALAQIKLGELKEWAEGTTMSASMDEVRLLVEQAIKSSRELTFELSPPILYDLGFESAVEWFGDYLQDHYGLQAVVQQDDQYKPMGNETMVLLFQMVRELMLNAAKHARARRVEVSIRRDGDNLLIDVTDDGVGFNHQQLPASREKPRSFGLFSVRERIECIGGSLQIDSRPTGGTKVSLTVPVWRDD
ncbi:MAG: PAS domain S-box protein [Thermodesulfobacteriota bacterium]